MLRRLLRSTTGSATIETAIVAPALVAMALGAFDASSMVARQSELQSAAAEAAAIVRAKPPENAAARTVIDNVVTASTGLGASNVVVDEIYRCATATAYSTTGTCAGGEKVWKYVRVTITDTYSPTWTSFGIGSDVAYNVVRTVQIS